MLTRSRYIYHIFVLIVFASINTDALAEYLVNDNFDAYSNISEVTDSGWGVQGNCTFVSSGGVTGGYINISYYAYNWPRLYRSMGDGWPEGYIGFYAKLTNKRASFPKFLKLFGVRDGDNYANWTMHQTSYTSAKLDTLYHGTGDTITNDSTSLNNWATGSSHTGTMNYYSGSEFTWPDENWHKFVVYWKMNTDGNTDGAYKVWVDDELQMDVSSVKNRNDANVRGFSIFALGEWTNVLPDEPYNLGFDNVAVASTYAEIMSALGTPADPEPSTTSGPILRTGTHLLRVGDSVLRVQ